MEVTVREGTEFTPNWLARGRIDEWAFCKEVLEYFPMVYSKGFFYDDSGCIRDEDKVRDIIIRKLMDLRLSGLAHKVESLLSTLKIMARTTYRIDESIAHIHVKNGYVDVGEGLVSLWNICRHRLPVNYNPKAPEPVRWKKFLSELLEPEDILTLQEFMGYCLIPTNMGQKMLIITGRGGEGKSRIGVIMKALLGDAMNQGSLSKVEHNAFARADLEHSLLMVDDDLRMDALKSTNIIKSLITAELPVDLERKGKQSYQAEFHCRFMAFGNGNLQALYDRSHGFFRRQIILSAKPRPKDRRDDPFLAVRLKEELEGIFLWCLEGLIRLLENNFVFTISADAQENMRQAVCDGNNVVGFMESEGYIRRDPLEISTCRQIYGAYLDWCEDNALPPLGSKSFAASLRQDSSVYNIQYDYNVPVGIGRRARGFKGIRVLPKV